MYIQYLWYIIRHKWYVFLECCKRGIPLLGVLHDLSKFSLIEWGAYARRFYGGEHPTFAEANRHCPGYTGHTKESVKEAFDRAWLNHQHNNKHHWQYWVLKLDSGGYKCLPMPSRYRREMVADWIGAGKANNNPDTRQWYLDNEHNIMLHPDTQDWVEQELGVT